MQQKLNNRGGVIGGLWQMFTDLTGQTELIADRLSQMISVLVLIAIGLYAIIVLYLLHCLARSAGFDPVSNKILKRAFGKKNKDLKTISGSGGAAIETAWVAQSTGDEAAAGHRIQADSKDSVVILGSADSLEKTLMKSTGKMSVVESVLGDLDENRNMEVCSVVSEKMLHM